MNSKTIAACICLTLASAASRGLAQQSGEAPAGEPRRIGTALGRLWDRTNSGKQPAKAAKPTTAPPTKAAPVVKLRAPVPPPPLPDEEELLEIEPAAEDETSTPGPEAKSVEELPTVLEQSSDEPEPARLPTPEASVTSSRSAHLSDAVRYGPVNRAAFKEPGGGSRIPPVKAALSRRFESVPAPVAKTDVTAGEALPPTASELAKIKVSVDDLSPARTMRAALPSLEVCDENLRTASAENASPAELLRAVHQFGRPRPTSMRVVARSVEQPQSGLQIPEAPMPEQSDRSIVRRTESRKIAPTPVAPAPAEPESEPEAVEIPQPVARTERAAPRTVEESGPAPESGDELPTISGTVVALNYNGKVVKLSFPEGTHLNLGDRVEVYHRAFFRTTYAGELEIIDHRRGLARPVDGLSIQKLSKGDEVVLTLEPVL